MASIQESEAQASEPRPLTIAELTREIQVIRRTQNELHNQVQNLIAKLANMERMVRAMPHRR